MLNSGAFETVGESASSESVGPGIALFVPGNDHTLSTVTHKSKRRFRILQEDRRSSRRRGGERGGERRREGRGERGKAEGRKRGGRKRKGALGEDMVDPKWREIEGESKASFRFVTGACLYFFFFQYIFRLNILISVFFFLLKVVSPFLPASPLPS